MNEQSGAHEDYDSLSSVLGAIAQWIVKYRSARGLRNEMMACGPEDVARIARELRIHPSELVALGKKGPNAADLLQKLLVALGVDAEGLVHDDPLVVRDLQRLCITCGYKRQCAMDLESGVMAENFRDYCPNAFTLNALIKGKQ
jgi:hypothetical protein